MQTDPLSTAVRFAVERHAWITLYDHRDLATAHTAAVLVLRNLAATVAEVLARVEGDAGFRGEMPPEEWGALIARHTPKLSNRKKPTIGERYYRPLKLDPLKPPAAAALDMADRDAALPLARGFDPGEDIPLGGPVSTLSHRVRLRVDKLFFHIAPAIEEVDAGGGDAVTIGRAMRVYESRVVDAAKAQKFADPIADDQRTAASKLFASLGCPDYVLAAVVTEG